MKIVQKLVGLEIHVQIKTDSKMFCDCSAKYFGDAPNTHTCPVCLGLPGALPIPNIEAIRRTIKVGLALNAEVNQNSYFERKNYYYPDLPKSYQLTQFHVPFVQNGWVEIDDGDDTKRIRVKEAHQEEDTAKSLHRGNSTLVDFNKSGIPLLEIVSEPDMTNGEEAKKYANKIRQIIRYLSVSDADMEKGSMRVEPTCSLLIEKDDGEVVSTPLVEVKNIGSINAAEKAVNFEHDRLFDEFKRNGEVRTETNKTTRGWDESKGETFLQREKEGAADYRFFPEPDIPPITISDELVEEIKSELPELPDAKRERFKFDYSLDEYSATILTSTQIKANWFEKTAEAAKELAEKEGIKDLASIYVDTAKWINGDLEAFKKKEKFKFKDLKIKPEHIAEISIMLSQKKISGKIGKELIQDALISGDSPMENVEKKGLEQISDESELETICKSVIDSNPGPAEQFRSGKDGVIGFFVGQVMKKTRGKANPQFVNDILRKLLSA